MSDGDNLYFPLFVSYPETAFDGYFGTEADYSHPVGKDVAAQLIYGVRLPFVFGLLLTTASSVISIGAIQG